MLSAAIVCSLTSNTIENGEACIFTNFFYPKMNTMTEEQLLDAVKEAFEREDYQLAQKKAQAVVEVNPESKAGYMMLGLSSIQIDELVQAKLAFFQITKLNEQDVEPYYHLAFIARAENGNSAATPYYHKILQINPSDEIALQSLAFFAYEAEEYNTAINYYKMLFEKGKQLKHVLQCAQIYQRQERAQEGLDLLQSFTPKEFNSVYTSMKKDFLLQLSMNKEALDCALEMLNHSPFNPELLMECADLFIGFKSYDVALDFLDKLIKYNAPKEYLLRAYEVRIAVYQTIEKYREAIEDCTTLLGYGEILGAKTEYYHGLRGAFNFELKAFKQALIDYNKVLELNPNSVEFLKKRGVLLFKSKKYDLAIRDLKKVLVTDSLMPDIHIYLAKIYLMQKNKKEALMHLHKADTMDSFDARALLEKYFPKQVTMLQNTTTTKLSKQYQQYEAKNQASPLLQQLFNKVWSPNLGKSLKAMQGELKSIPAGVTKLVLAELSENRFVITPDAILFFEGKKRVLEAYYSIELESSEAILLQVQPTKGGRPSTMRLFMYEEALGITYPIGTKDVSSRYFSVQTSEDNAYSKLKGYKMLSTSPKSIQSLINQL